MGFYKKLVLKAVAFVIAFSAMLFPFRLFAQPIFPITIAPYFGIDSESIVNIPGYNQDVKMLQQNALLEKNFEKKYQTYLFQSPTLQLSGKIEGLGNFSNHSQDLNLSAAEIDLGLQFNPWIIGFMDFAYTKSENENNPNSLKGRINLDRAFITTGNFNVIPFYATLGKRWVPFGQYFSYMVSGPLTQSIGGMKYPSFLLGYQHPGNKGIYTSLYTLQGNSGISSHSQLNYGGTLGYDIQNHTANIDIGIDYIRNIADGQNFQCTHINIFKGFTTPSDFELLHKEPPGLDTHLKINIKKITFLAEYTTALSTFNKNDLSFNQHGAKVWAAHTEIGYNFKIHDYPSSVAIGYDKTGQALALNLPENRYLATFNISPWKNTIVSIELQHGKNYSQDDQATGKTSPVIYGNDETSNGVAIRLGAFF